MACTAAPKFNDDDGSARFETARTLRDVGLQSRAGGASPSVRSGIYLGRKASTVAASSGASALVEWRWMQIANPEFLSAMKTHVMTHIKGGTNWQTLAPTAEEQRWVEQKVGHIFEKPDVLRARADVHATEGPRFSILSDLSVQRYSMDWLRDFSLDCIVTELLEQDIDAFFDPDEDTSGVRGAGETSSPTISARASDMNKFVRAACSWIPSLRGLSVDPEERESPYTSEQLIDVCSYVLNAAPGTTTKQLHAELSKCLPEGSLLESDLEIAVSKVRKRDLLNHPCTTASAAGAAAGAAAARSAAEEAAAANEEAGAAGAAAGAAAAAELLAEVATAPPATAGSSVTHEGLVPAGVHSSTEAMQGMAVGDPTPASSSADAGAFLPFATAAATEDDETEGAEAAPSSPRPEKRGAGGRLSPGSAKQTRKQPVPPSRDGWGMVPPPREGFRTLGEVQKKARKSREEERRREHEAGGAASSSAGARSAEPQSHEGEGEEE